MHMDRDVYSKRGCSMHVVSKMKTACEVSGRLIFDHFADVGRMVELGSGCVCELDDIMLTHPDALDS